MTRKVEITCACGCGRTRYVRVADRSRGWGRYYSKACKAREQERRTGQYRRLLDYPEADPCEHAVGHIFDPGYWGHGQT